MSGYEKVLKSNTQVWIDDGVRTDIKRKGHGLQRALTVALIQVIANRSNGSQGSGNRQASNSKYFIFEEPELYLHPQAQRSLFDMFVRISELDDNQVMLCTHSAGLIDIERYKSIYIATKKNNGIGTEVKQCTDNIFDLDDKKNFNLSYWINPERGELFFATKVVLLEGATEKTVFPHLAKKISVFKHEYTLIDCGSKNNIPLYIRLLNKFKIPYLVVYDKDHQVIKNQQAIDSANMATNAIESEIDSNLGKSVILVNDIEEELGLPKGSNSKPYSALSYINEPSFTITEEMKQKIQTIFE